MISVSFQKCKIHYWLTPYKNGHGDSYPSEVFSYKSSSLTRKWRHGFDRVYMTGVTVMWSKKRSLFSEHLVSPRNFKRFMKMSFLFSLRLVIRIVRSDFTVSFSAGCITHSVSCYVSIGCSCHNIKKNVWYLQVYIHQVIFLTFSANRNRRVHCIFSVLASLMM